MSISWFGIPQTTSVAVRFVVCQKRSRCGIVLKDPRVDWKLKVDIAVIVPTEGSFHNFLISEYANQDKDRGQIESARLTVELQRKARTLGSSQIPLQPMLKSFHHIAVSLGKD